MEDFIKATDSLNEGRKKLNAIAKEMNEKDVASMPEIVNARAGEPSLKARLDKEHENVTAQLAQITNRVRTDTLFLGDWEIKQNKDLNSLDFRVR